MKQIQTKIDCGRKPHQLSHVSMLNFSSLCLWSQIIVELLECAADLLVRGLCNVKCWMFVSLSYQKKKYNSLSVWLSPFTGQARVVARGRRTAQALINPTGPSQWRYPALVSPLFRNSFIPFDLMRGVSSFWNYFKMLLSPYKVLSHGTPRENVYLINILLNFFWPF